MIIVFVWDQYDNLNNGTTATTRRFVELLRERGHTVRVLSTGKEEPDKWVVRQWRGKTGTMWIENILEKQGMAFGYCEEQIVRNCFEGADVIHFISYLGIAWHAIDIAIDMKIPFTTACHIQPENIFYTIYLEKLQCLGILYYKLVNKVFYKKAQFVHTPTQFIKDRLIKEGYKCDIRVASNGVSHIFHRLPYQPKRPEEWMGKYIIANVGRYSREKRQDVLIRAVAQSKYKDQIVVVLAGRGLTGPVLEKLAKKFNVNVSFGMYTSEKLCEILNMCDLYCHTADAESEAIACLEAITCGVVPVISNHRNSATRFFALDDRSLFQHGKPQELAKKIDYWLDRPEERKEFGKVYEEKSNQYSIDKSMEIMEQMFEDAIEFYHNKYSQEEEKEKEGKKNMEKKRETERLLA